MKFNKIGKIVKGENPNWYILIIDERHNNNSKVKTGGIYIFQSNNIEFNSSNDNIVYDDWVKDTEGLEIFFSEPEWDIIWTDINSPITI